MLWSLITTLTRLAWRLRPRPLDRGPEPMPRIRWYT
jgi:hypothetical protein